MRIVSLLFCLVVAGPAGAILGGATVRANDGLAQSVVYIVSFGEDNKAIGMCSGTFVADDTVLTAAHCIHPLADHYQIRFIDWRLKKTLQIRQSNKGAFFAEFVRNDFSRPGESSSDVALLFFRGGLPRGARVAPLIPAGFTQDAINPISSLKIYGYGIQDETMRDRLLKYATGVFLDGNIGTLHVQTGGLTCKGDSGGPVFVEYHGSYYVAGVTSAGPNVPVYDPGTKLLDKCNEVLTVAYLFDEIFNVSNGGRSWMGRTADVGREALRLEAAGGVPAVVIEEPLK